MKSKRRLLSLILVFSMIAGLYPNSYVYAYSDTESLEVSSEETADEATTAYPAFHPEPVIMDGVEIKVSADEGVFPESAVLSVNKPKASEEKKIENIIEEERSGTENVAASYTYDIKVLDADGNELQPEDGQKVEVSFSMAEVSNTNLDTNVYHISEDKSGELSADTLHVSENDDTVTAETDGFSYYTVEFTYDEKQYVMEGDTSVALTDILSYVGITKADGNVATDSDVTAVSVSDESLFSASNESGVWIVTAHQAFHTDEWMKVTVDGVEYEIKITDSMQITITIESVTTTSDKGKTFMCFSLAPSYNELNNYNGGDGRPNWGLPRYSTSGDITITVDSMPDNLYFYVEYNDGGGGGTTGPIGTLSNGVSNTLTATYSYSSGWPANINITYATATIKYHVNKASDPSVTAPTLASGLTYTGSAKQLISSAGSTSGNNMQYGISSSNTTQPTSWYGSISDNNMKKTDVGTYYVWYKCDAVSNYNAVAATCVGSVSIAKASNPITYGPQSWSYKYATTAQTKTLNAATSAQGTVTYSLQSQKKGNNTVNYFTFNTSTRVLTAAKNTPTGTYTVVVRASAAGGSNYNSGTADSTITVTVNKAAGSISYGTPAVTKTYGDSAFTNALTKAGDGTVSYSSSNTSVASINSNGQVTIVGAGTATITATVADGTNYSYASKTAAYSLTVNRKAITIKANDQTITYGGTISTGTDKVTVNTLVSGNTLSTITLTPSTSGATTNGTITPGNAAIIKNNTDVTNNYEISYQNGKLVIDKANISPAVNITGWTYGEYSPEINSPSVTGNTGNGAVTYEYKVKDAADNTYTASVPTDAGNYTVRATIAETSNYNGRTATKDFTITKRNVTLTSASDTKAYNGTALTNDDITVGGDGFADNEGAEYDVTGTQTLPGESDNTFTYELTGAKPDNYNITIAYGKLTVNERNGEGDDGKYKITVKANSGTFIYDGKAHTVTGFETLEYTINDVTYTVSGISASGSLTDAGETPVEITGTPKVADAEGNDLTGSFDVICEDGKLTVKKCSQEKPDGLSSRKTSSNTAKDGVITGLDENKLYEYSEDDGINWNKVDEGSAEVTGIGAGDVLVRFQEDGNRLPGEVADVIVGIKENQAAPLREDFVITNASEENASDGKISGVDDTMEYSLDDGKNWTPVEENQTLIDNLPVGDTELRYKGDEDKNPGEALKIPIGVTSRTQGVVNFNHNNTSETEISVTTVVEAAASSNIEDFAATQMKEGKDVKVELEIIPKKEEEVSEESVAKIGDTVKEVFAGIETESIVTEYLQIDLAKYVDNAKEGNISDTKTPLEIELKYDKSKTGNPVIIRTHNGAVKAFEKLMTRPAGGFRDGTYHVADGKIYLYSQYFSDFAIVYATEKTYYVNIDLGNGESIQKIVGENDGIELPANLTREGYSFGGLYKDASYKDAWNYDTDKVNEDITLYGKWNRSVSGVSVTPSEMKLNKAGETLQIKVTVTPADAANTKVTYKSSDAKVATVDANGKITAVANGTATITVTTEDGAKTATVKVTVAIPNVSKQGTSEQTTTEQPKTTEQPLQEPAKEEKAEISMNAGFKIFQTGSKINIKWGKVKEADGYDVYVTYCGMVFNKKKPNKTLKKNSLVSTTITKINGKKINLKKNYKIYVVAYRMVEGKKVKLARTITGHIVGRLNTKYSNVRKITLSKSKYSVKVGKTVKVKAKTVLVAQSKKQLSDAHAAEFRYATSNKNIATVDKNGKVKGIAKGTCTIYVYARNGYAKTVSVTVK